MSRKGNLKSQINLFWFSIYVSYWSSEFQENTIPSVETGKLAIARSTGAK